MRPTRLWTNRDFVKLWTGQTVSKFGTHITSAAIAATAVLVLQATPAQMGFLGAIEGLPVLLLSLFAGVWVDRLRRKPILITADLGRAVILLSIPVAAFLNGLRMENLYLVVGLVGVLSVLYNVADQSYLPALVRQEQLIEANARLGSSESIAEVAGPSIAGTLVQWLGAPFAILVDSATYLFSAGCLGAIRTPEPQLVRSDQPHLWREMKEGLRAVLGNPVLRALMGATATHTFFGSFIGTIYWIFLVRDLYLSPAVVGVSIGFGGIGAFVGTFIVGGITHRLGVGKTLISSLLIVGLFSLPLLLPLETWQAGWVIALLFAIQLGGDIFWSVFFINVTSLRQGVIPPQLLGRASATLDFAGEGSAPLGALVGGLVASFIGARFTWLLGAAGILIASLWLIFSPVRRIR
jgi:predicted MFS family arabinose efflux permease